MTSASAADLAFLISGNDLSDWSLPVALVVGGTLAFIVVWAITRHARRTAYDQAAELVEVGRREAAVAAEEVRQKAEAEIRQRRVELNREFDRREIESEVRLREIAQAGTRSRSNSHSPKSAFARSV